MLPTMVYQRTSRHIDGHVHVHRDDLKRMFHLPLADAACKIGLCSTTFKKTCRRLGIEAWPYQKQTKSIVPWSYTKQTKSRVAHTYPQIVTDDTLREQSVFAPADMDQRARAVVPMVAQQKLTPCIEAVMDYLDACDVKGHSGFLFLLENEGHEA
jgi:hypothetical protein